MKDIKDSKLRNQRQAKGWTQESVGHEIDVSGTTIGRWETGETPIPYHQQVKLEKLFGVDQGYFATDKTGEDNEIVELENVTPIIQLMKNQPGLMNIYIVIVAITILVSFMRPYATISMILYALTMMLSVIIGSSPRGKGTLWEKGVMISATLVCILVGTTVCLMYS